MNILKPIFAASLTIAALNGTLLATDLPRTADHDYDAPVPGSYQLPIVMRAADGEVLDSSGRPLHLSELTHIPSCGPNSRAGSTSRSSSIPRAAGC